MGVVIPWPGNPPITRAHTGGEMGADWGMPIGTPIVAAADGVVTRIGMSGFGPAYVEIEDANGLATFYGHNDRALVKVGDHVTAGQLIAYSGNQGHSTGPHIEFGVKVHGQLIDPVAWLRDNGAIPPSANPSAGGGDSGGPIPGWVPGSDQINGIISVIAAVDKVFVHLLDPAFWVRLGKGGAGLFVIAVAILLVHRSMAS